MEYLGSSALAIVLAVCLSSIASAETPTDPPCIPEDVEQEVLACPAVPAPRECEPIPQAPVDTQPARPPFIASRSEDRFRINSVVTSDGHCGSCGASGEARCAEHVVLDIPEISTELGQRATCLHRAACAATDQMTRAEILFREARLLYDANRFAEAAVLFREIATRHSATPLAVPAAQIYLQKKSDSPKRRKRRRREPSRLKRTPKRMPSCGYSGSPCRARPREESRR